jgi:glycosyltransferase involved in cell wall biosynthesis
VPAEKIVVTYEGVSSLFQPVIVDFNKLSKFSISTKFILSVSALEPRKNIKTLIKAFLNLKEQGKLNEYQLVIVGEPWRKAAEIYKMAKGYKDIVFTGYVSEDDLVLLYNAAEIFVYPSFYEGFGLPPLEALACGTPVIAVNSSSISEVVGDSALLINEPENVQEFSNAILTLIESLHLKQKLKEKGLAQVKKFSWEKMVQQTISVYESITK